MGDKIHLGLSLQLSCIVIGGDSPIKIAWLKDGHVLTSFANLHYEFASEEAGRSRRHGWDECAHDKNESALLGPPASAADLALLDERGRVGEPDPKVVINHLGDRYSELRLTTLCPRHSGNYTCIAENNFGVGSTSVFVAVKGKWSPHPHSAFRDDGVSAVPLTQRVRFKRLAEEECTDKHLNKLKTF